MPLGETVIVYAELSSVVTVTQSTETGSPTVGAVMTAYVLVPHTLLSGPTVSPASVKVIVSSLLSNILIMDADRVGSFMIAPVQS